MGTLIDLQVGTDTWPITVPQEKAVELRREPRAERPTASPHELVAAALDSPFRFEPLRRAVTPDDRITIAVDGALPHAAEIVSAILSHLETAGVPAANVTLLMPPDANTIDLPDVTTMVHDPADAKKLAYLATTKAGRRVYLNRALVEADYSILLTDIRYDPVFGYHSTETLLYPTFASAEIRNEFAGLFTVDAPSAAAPWSPRAEAMEVAALFGLPFLVQVLTNEDRTIQDVIAGLQPSSAEAVRRLDMLRRGTVEEEPDTVIAVVSGTAQTITFADIATAAAMAARVVEADGRIVVLTPTVPLGGVGFDIVRGADSPRRAEKRLAKHMPADWAEAFLWTFAAYRGRLNLSGCGEGTLADDLFATPLTTAAEVQRLIDASKRLLVIPNAQRMMVTLA